MGVCTGVRAGPWMIGTIETRWRERLGTLRIDALREPLQALARQLPLELPRYPPVSFWLMRGPLRYATV